MARTNARGLELSFKRYPGQSRGRWFKTIQGKERYFGPGSGVSDRASYRLALEKYRTFQQAGESQHKRQDALAHLSALLAATSPDGSVAIPLGEFRRHVEGLSVMEGEQAHEAFAEWADDIEKGELIEGLRTLPLQQLRTVQPVTGVQPARTVGDLLTLFLAEQKGRHQAGKHFDSLREKGQQITAPKGETIGDARLVSIRQGVRAFRACLGSERWDGTEGTASRLAKKWRDASTQRFHGGIHAAGTFNERVKFLRLFMGWCETNHHLDHLPRDKKLFGKIEYTASAKAVPIAELQKLYAGASDLERTWLLLALNCDYYAQDISDLTAEMVAGGYIDHTRGKTAVNVRYKLWPETIRRLSKFLPEAGPVFLTGDRTPLVHFRPAKKDRETLIRVDNVRNHFYRLAAKVRVPTGKEGYSFSNVRDTASTEVEKIDRAYTDIFCAHRDNRMARFYVDGKHSDTSGLDAVIDRLELVFRPLWEASI